MAKYWFARRFPVEVGGDRMSPISQEGWLVVWSFVGSLVLGFAALALFTLVFQKPLIGFITLLMLASLGMSAFLMLAQQRGDKRHTAEDYKQGRVTNG